MDDAGDDAPDATDLDAAVTDADDPYAAVDVSALPEWWREAIEEFEAHDLRPFQPPRFSDGVLIHRIVDELEETHGVDIDFVGVNVTYGDDWAVRVDGESIGTIGHRRSPDAYTVFEMDSDDFAGWIAEHV